MKAAWLTVLVVGFAPPAFAFHTVDTFSDPTSEGGAAGVYYTGSPRFRAWDCTACHLDPSGELLLDIASEPASLFTDGAYVPEAVYEITVGLRNESRGLDANANYNTVAVEILDARTEPVGGFFGFDENLMKATPGGDVLFARGQKNLEVASWTFRWQAPPAGTGFVDVYLAGVDGDGAGSVEAEQSDPLGDDVVTGRLRIAEVGVPLPIGIVGGVDGGGCRGATGDLGTPWGLGLALFALRRRRRQERGNER